MNKKANKQDPRVVVDAKAEFNEPEPSYLLRYRQLLHDRQEFWTSIYRFINEVRFITDFQLHIIDPVAIKKIRRAIDLLSEAIEIESKIPLKVRKQYIDRIIETETLIQSKT